MSWRKVDQARVAGTTGAAVGLVATRLAGVSAAAMVGRGAGFGCAAGPVGMVVGGLAGLALFGLIEAICDDDDD